MRCLQRPARPDEDDDRAGHPNPRRGEVTKHPTPGRRLKLQKRALAPSEAPPAKGKSDDALTPEPKTESLSPLHGQQINGPSTRAAAHPALTWLPTNSAKLSADAASPCPDGP